MKKKWCSGCQCNLDERLFNKNSRRKDGLQTICRDCSARRSRQYYADNRERHKKVIRARIKRIQKENQLRLWEYLRDKKCADCGESDPLVLTFDHVRGAKRAEIGKLLQDGFGWATIEDEILKCEIRCANCHLRKTSRTHGHFRYFLRLREQS